MSRQAEKKQTDREKNYLNQIKKDYLLNLKSGFYSFGRIFYREKYQNRRKEETERMKEEKVIETQTYTEKKQCIKTSVIMFFN
jgi:hypothetical protein